MSAKGHRRKFRWWMAAVIAVGVVLAGYSLTPKPVEIRAAKVNEGELQLSLSSTGIVEADLSDVAPKITAAITGLYAEEGQPVERGQVLAQLEDSDLKAEVDRLRAAVRAAEQEVLAARKSAAAQTGQLAAAVKRAQASVNASRERLKELQAGSRKEDIEAQRALLAQAKAEAEDARRKFERAEELLSGGAISAQDRDTARTAHEAAEATVEARQQQLRRLEAGPRQETIDAARAELAAAEAARQEAEASLGLAAARQSEAAAAEARLSEARAALQSAQAQLSYASITSPVRGYASRRHMEVGEVATPFDPIYTIANLDNIRVIAEVDEEDAAAVALGQSVKITLDAYPGKSVYGKVVRVSRVAEPKEVGRVRAKIVRARIHLARTSIPLRPGMEVNVTGQVPVDRRTLLVPNDAVTRVGDSDSAFVVEDGVAKRRKIKTGQSNFDYIQVLSGLSEGELVAVSSLDQLSDGTRVNVGD